MSPDINDNYFYQSRKFRIGSAVVICIVVLYLAGLFAFEKYSTNHEKSEGLTASQQKLLDQIQQDTGRYKKQYADDYTPYKNYEQSTNNYKKIDYALLQLFDFDPNTIPVATWEKLGVKEKTAQGIRNYIAKGGRFRKPEDVKKIWGIAPEHAERLLPYVKIPANETTYSNITYTNTYEKPVYKPRTYASIDINEADTIMWASLPGIGPGYARRIVKFRDRLGGFCDIKQVAETFGLPDSTYQKILPYLKGNADNINKININTVTQEELQLHPYIRWQLAKVIIAYRDQHGAYKSLEELNKIMIITPEVYEKIKPYLTL